MVSRFNGRIEVTNLTAFKTISMRIRGAKTELEEAGLETDGMAESTALLREELMALSGVDIMEMILHLRVHIRFWTSCQISGKI